MTVADKQAKKPVRFVLSDKQRLAWLRLYRSDSVGPATFRDLIAHCGSAELALEMLPELSARGGNLKSVRIADPDDADGDGISGRPQLRRFESGAAPVLGRFGWKAGQPSLRQQNAEAFANDMGLNSHLVPTDSCAPSQADCLAMPNGGEVEVSDSIMDSVLFYTRNLAVPARRNVDDPQVLKGKSLFHQANCQGCHVPSFTTGNDAAEPELANQTVRPYTDLLLHDMGPGLADGRPEFLANGQEWRTPPLWGIGLTEAVNGHTQFLHDGRARNLMEAILWHDGEAAASRDKVLAFDAEQRAALLAFLNSL